jgi:hypothetical protein
MADAVVIPAVIVRSLLYHLHYAIFIVPSSLYHLYYAILIVPSPLRRHYIS